jgi:hypothetical protein
MTIATNDTREGKMWLLYWSGMPVPQGAAVVGTVRRGRFDAGALFLLPTGLYVQGNAGSIRTLPQCEVRDSLRAVA